MTPQTASQPTSSPTFHGRSRLAMARDVVVVAICAVVVAGFLLDVSWGARQTRPSTERPAALAT
jgi:hypothetical protein